MILFRAGRMIWNMLIEGVKGSLRTSVVGHSEMYGMNGQNKM